MDLAKKLHTLRKAHGYSTTDLSKHTGVSQSYISDIENGRKESPSKKIIEKLASALQVEPSFFFNDNLITPLDFLSHLPPEIKDFILNKENLPYLKLAANIKEQGLLPEVVDEVLKMFKIALEMQIKK